MSIHLVHFLAKNPEERSIYRLSQNIRGLENSLLTERLLIGHVVIVGFDAQKTFH